MTRIAIIGAGLSGLSMAHLLKDYAQVSLFEKARGVGGRISTRRAEPYCFDHGAQYFTARTRPFQDFIQPLLDQGMIQRWNARYLRFDNNQIIERKNWINQEPRYVGTPSMNQVAKFLAQGLDIRTNTRVVFLNHQGTWHLTCDQNRHYSGFDWLICTAPSPQALQLLPQSFLYHSPIKAAPMQACFSLMLGFKQAIALEFEAAHLNSDLSWIAVNSHKPQRPDAFSLVIHSSARYAQAHIDNDPEQVMQHLINQTSPIIGQDASNAEHRAIHKWRYANTRNRNQINPAYLDREHRLAACGDWCVGGRVEDAFTSAYNLALKMKEMTL